MADDSVAASQLRSFVERIERTEEEIAALNTDKRDIYAEAKGNGFDVAVLKQVVKIRKQDTNERMEREAILELYLNALGMSGAVQDETEDRAPARAGAPARARENIEEFDADGVITEPVSAPQHGAGAPSSPDAPATQSPRKAAEAEGEIPRIEAQEVSEAEGLRPVDASAFVGSSNGRTSAFDADNAGSTPAPATNSVVMTREQGILRLRPNCLAPSACKSSGGREHCYGCKKAAAEAKAGAA